MRFRLLAVVLAVSAASVASTFLPGPAIATTIVRAGAIADVDGDTIPDGIERVVCGSATCATGTEDTDGDGVPDVVEVAACGSTSCADPGADVDGDGIPDFVERLVCGSATCTSGREDVDGDGVPDWVEYLVCGTATCATGTEDLDGDGVADASALQAYATYRQNLAVTGREYAWVTPAFICSGLLVLVGAALMVVRARRRAEAAGVTR